jgi:hypothetical protein
VILVFRMKRLSAVRPMRLPALWIRPAILAVMTGMLVFYAPPQGATQDLILLAALAVGALLGWHQARLMAISVDPESGSLQVKASTWALVTFFGVLLLRMGLRPLLTDENSPVHAYVGVITDGFLLFLVGFYLARATEMFIRGRALLQASRSQLRSE